jgi:two-component system chemotaxis response regulator CheY
MTKTIMIVDDSASIRTVVGIALRGEGYQVMPAYRFTPIIMLTTESDESKKRQGQEAGAKAWVVKPFKPEQMLSAVQRLCLP